MKSTLNQAPALFEGEEYKYKVKCRDLKRRIQEIDEYNELMILSIDRTKRAIQRLRLERALILEKLEETTDFNPGDETAEFAVSPPGSPIQYDLIKKHASGTQNKGHGKGSGKGKTKSKDKGADKIKGEDDDHDDYHDQDDENENDNDNDTYIENGDEEDNENDQEQDQTLANDHEHNSDDDFDEKRVKEEEIERSNAILNSNNRKSNEIPTKPVKPRNAFQLYSESEKENVIAELKEKDPGKEFDESELRSQVNQTLSQAWKNMGKSNRDQYYDKYEAAKARYERDLADYEAYLKEEEEKEKVNDDEVKGEVKDEVKEGDSDVLMEDVGKQDVANEEPTQAPVEVDEQASVQGESAPIE